MANFTPQQQAVIEAFSKPGPNLIVNACAGSGKTTTLAASMTEAFKNDPSLAIGVFSFGKLPAEELAKRLPKGIDSSTTHSLCLRAWMAGIGKKLSLDKKKTWECASDLLGDADCPGLGQAVGLAKSYGYYPDGTPGSPSAPRVEKETFLDFLSDYPIDTGTYQGDFLELIDETLRRSIRRGWAGSLDYDDMIYLPAIYGRRMVHSTGRPFDLICVDETQDLNRVQRLVFHSANASRYGFIGDPGQSIYGFRGADHESMDRLKEEFDCTEMNLTVSFRCPKAVVAAAVPYFQGIEAHPDAPEGLLDWDAKMDLKTGDAVLCRNNAPLVRLAFSLIASGIPARVMGRDISGVIQNQIKKAAKGNPDTPVKDLLTKIQNEIEGQKVTARIKQNESRVQALEDRFECILAVAGGLPAGATARDLVRRVEMIFDGEHSPITLSTIHKAKGLEWNRVWILDFSLIGARAATPKALRQEHNLAYVGITRAKSELRFINTERN